jgi:tetratricopeptide (TPR) repeat protein
VPGQRAELAALSVLETTFGVALERPVVELPAGLEDASPAELPTLRAGQELLIAARMNGPVSGDVVLRGTVGGKAYENRFPLALAPSQSRGNAFVPRVWAALTIERMELDGQSEDQARIVAMSQAYGVLSRHTSLLVLESPAMFRAFGVDRSRSLVSWSGDEAAEGVESTGAVDFAVTRSAGATGGVLASVKDDDGASEGDADAALAPPAEPAATEDREDRAGRAKKTKAAEKAPSLPSGRRPGGRVWIPMRREWFRTGSIRDFDGISPVMLDAVARAEAALASQPDSRERHRALVQALAYSGDLERAYQLASKWLERDRLDPEALATMADLLGRQGRRAEAVRLLSGVVDLEPENRALHARLAAAYDRIGASARSCGHRIALAALAPADGAALGGALRCQRATGLAAGADRLLRATSDKLRAALELRAAQPATGERATGELIIDASWSDAVDLDVSLVTPDGRRVSWLGGRNGLAVERAGEAGRERLALRRLPAGNYLVEVARTDPADQHPIAGSVTLRALAASRTLPFSMTGPRTVIARVTVARRSRLVPLEPGTVLLPR